MGFLSHDKESMAASNAAAEFVLGELRLHQSRVDCSGMENPANSLHCTHLQKLACSSRAHGGTSSMTPAHSNVQEGGGSAFAMTSKKSDPGQICM